MFIIIITIGVINKPMSKFNGCITDEEFRIYRWCITNTNKELGKHATNGETGAMLGCEAIRVLCEG